MIVHSAVARRVFALKMWILYTIFGLSLLKLYNKCTCGWCHSKRVMTGKVVVITGANSGIGFETAVDLASRGAKVILACRDEKRGTQAAHDVIEKTGNKNVVYKNVDLSSFKSIRRFVEDLNKTEAKLDVLINNAGVAGFQDKITEDGLVYDLQANHFGPFLLTLLLIPLLKKSAAARVINVSSVAHKYGDINFLDINTEKTGIIVQTKVYSNTKLCNVLFTNELARRLKGTNITINALHPGVVSTPITRNMRVVRYFLDFIYSSFFKTPVEGAQTSIYLAVSGDVEGVTGKYFADCKETSMSAKAKDVNLAKQLWEYSEKVSHLEPTERIL